MENLPLLKRNQVYYFKFLHSIRSVLPFYFNKKIKCFNSLFSGYSKYKSDMTLVSNYNCIYDCCKLNLKCLV